MEERERERKEETNKKAWGGGMGWEEAFGRLFSATTRSTSYPWCSKEKAPLLCTFFPFFFWLITEIINLFLHFY